MVSQSASKLVLLKKYSKLIFPDRAVLGKLGLSGIPIYKDTVLASLAGYQGVHIILLLVILKNLVLATDKSTYVMARGARKVPLIYIYIYPLYCCGVTLRITDQNYGYNSCVNHVFERN